MDSNRTEDGDTIKNGDSKSIEKLALPMSKTLKYLTTVAIMLGNITFGCAFNFYSPALEDLRIKYNTNVDDISTVFTIMLAMYCLGALSAGFIYRIVHRQLGVMMILGGMAIGLYATPHCPSKAVFFTVGGILGYFIGAYDVSQVVWIIEIWQEKSGPFIQTQHFCYAVGSNIPPLLLGPFLRGDVDEDTIVSTTVEIDKESKIYIPFTIGGGFSTAALAFQLLLFIFYRYHAPPMYADDNNDVNSNTVIKDEKDIEKKELKYLSWAYITSPKFKLIVITGAFLGAYQGMEMTTMQFIPTFGQYSNLKLSESDSAFVLTGLTGAFAVGRFLGIFIILKVHPVIMLGCNLVLVLGGGIILLLWASDSNTMLWVACCVIGSGFSTVYASFSGFIEKHLIITDGIGSLMIVCGSAVAAIYPLIVGNGIEDNVIVLTYPIFFSVGICSLTLAWGHLLTRKSLVRY